MRTAALLLLAVTAAAHEDPSARIERLTLLMDHQPPSAALLIERADLLRRQGQHARALADLDAAERLAPTDRGVHLARGLVRAAMGERAQAEAAFTRFLRSGPPTASALAARAQVRASPAEAIADYDAAIALGGDPDLYAARGRLQEETGQLAAAAHGYEQGLRALGGPVSLRLALIRVEKARGRFAHAIALVNEMLPSLPAKAEWWILRADLHEAAGHARAARADRRRALAELDGALRVRPTESRRLARARVARALEASK